MQPRKVCSAFATISALSLYPSSMLCMGTALPQTKNINGSVVKNLSTIGVITTIFGLIGLSTSYGFVLLQDRRQGRKTGDVIGNFLSESQHELWMFQVKRKTPNCINCVYFSQSPILPCAVHPSLKNNCGDLIKDKNIST